MWSDTYVEVYKASYRPLVRLAFVMLGSRAEAEEVVQDAAISTGMKEAELENPGAYLRRAVVNGAIGVLRRRQVADRVKPDPPPVNQPVELVELRDSLLRLPEQQRAAIVLRYLEGLPDREIAEMLDCREGTVRSLVSRGLAALRSEVVQ
jgi:RNA polymerase sigma factor (sigma-70 family)